MICTEKINGNTENVFLIKQIAGIIDNEAASVVHPDTKLDKARPWFRSELVRIKLSGGESVTLREKSVNEILAAISDTQEEAT